MIAEGYKDTEIGVIPVEWDVETFETISELNRGTSFTKRNLIEGNIPVIAGGKEPAYYHNDYNREGETITISGSGANAGYVNFFTTKIFMSDGFTVKGKTNKSLTKYLYYYLKNKQEYIYYQQSGGAQPHIYTKNIAPIQIPLPPLQEQKQIADILSTADDKIDAIASQIKKAQILKKGLLQKLLSEGIGHSEFKDSELGKIPLSWEVVELPHITDKITSGGTPSRNKAEYFENGTVNWIKTGELRDCYIYNSKEKITEDAVANSSAKVFPIDTLLIAMYGATIGRTAYLKTECSTNQACCAIIFNQSIADPYFYWKYFHFIKDDLISQGRGAGQPNISQAIIKTLFVPLPPLEEQKQIAEILSTADEKLEVLKAKKEKYETLKKGLLQKLLSGEIRV